MSLINQMLQDLDARRAAHGVGASLPDAVRPLPPAPRSRLPVILGVLCVLAGSVAAYQWAARQPAAAIPAVMPVAAPALPAPPPAESAKVAEAVQSPPAVPATDVSAPQGEGGLRMTGAIASAEKSADAKAESVPAAVVKAPIDENKSRLERRSVEKSERSAAPVAAAPALSAAASPTMAKAARPVLIERSDAAASPRERADSAYRKAIAALNEGRVDEAVDGLRNALRDDGLHGAARQLLVKLLLEAKRSDEAIAVLHDGLQGQPAQIAWAMSLARLQMDRGDLAGAWQTLSYSEPAAGSNADYQGFMGHVLQRLARHRDAAERYRAATRLAPGDGRWWLGLGLALDAEGQVSEAREAFLRARQSGNLGSALSALVEQKLR